MADDKGKKDDVVGGFTTTGSIKVLLGITGLLIAFYGYDYMWVSSSLAELEEEQAQIASTTASSASGQLNDQKPQEKVIWIGSENQPTSIRVTLSPHEWSDRIEFLPGAHNEAWIIPPTGGMVEIQNDDYGTHQLRWEDVQHGNDVELGSLISFRLRGEGVATVQTRPMRQW